MVPALSLGLVKMPQRQSVSNEFQTSLLTANDLYCYFFILIFFNVLYFSFNDTEIYSPLELGACFSNRQTLAHVFIYIYEQQYGCFIVFQYATEWQSSSTHLSFFLSLILMAVFFLLIWWICIEKLDEKFLDQTKFSCNYGFIVPLNFQCFFMFFNGIMIEDNFNKVSKQ